MKKNIHRLFILLIILLASNHVYSFTLPQKYQIHQNDEKIEITEQSVQSAKYPSGTVDLRNWNYKSKTDSQLSRIKFKSKVLLILYTYKLCIHYLQREYFTFNLKYNPHYTYLSNLVLRI